MGIKIIDTFIFNGEWAIKMRLEFMAPFVDEFVIVEARHTFNGEKKTFLYRDKWADIFKPYQHKIYWVIVDEFPPMTDTWQNAYKNNPSNKGNTSFNEHYQRDMALPYIRDKHKEDEYIVNVGDVDEIPNIDIFHPDVRPTMLHKLQEQEQPLYLEMIYYYYNFYWNKPHNWYKSYIIDKDRLMAKPSLSFWRYQFPPNLVLRTAGWHFSLFMELDAIQERVRILHNQIVNADCVKESIAHGKDLLLNSPSLIHDESISFPDIFSSYCAELDYLQLS